jgi:hypothetical protein
MSKRHEYDLLTAPHSRQIHTKRNGSVSGQADSPILLSLLGNQVVGSLLGRVIQRCGPEHPDCDCPAGARGESRTSDTRVGVPLTVPMITQLQRLAGNAAVTQFLQRDNDDESQESDGGTTEESDNICGFEVGGSSEDTDEGSMVAQGFFVSEAGSCISLYQDDATVVCDGAGGFRPDLRAAANFRCGLPDCTERHERSHIHDLNSNPKTRDICNGRKDGDEPDYSKHMKPDEQVAFAKKTELKAYKVSLACVKKLLEENKKAEDPLACKDYLTHRQWQMESCIKDKDHCSRTR